MARTIDDAAGDLAAQLRASEERYRHLVDNIDDIIFSTDLDGKITFVNAALRRFGYEPEECIGLSRESFVHPDDQQSARARREAELAGRAPPSALEYRLVDVHGQSHAVRAKARPLIVEGEVVGVTGVITDLTAQRATEEQLRAAQKMEAVGRLAGGVAHDFNNILSVILSYSELAMRSLRAEDPLKEDLGEIHAAAKRAEALTRQLLAFSRRQMLAPEPLDVGQLVAGVGNMLRRLIGEDIVLEIERSEGLFEVKVDKGQLEQVVMNLVVNARDAMPEGGRIRIETRNVVLGGDASSRLDLPKGDYVELLVADTGSGMTPETIARAFEPFFTTKPVGRGTGLGLSTVYGIVKQSGGSVAVESTIGQGTTFRIYLPRYAGPAVEPRAAATGPLRVVRGHETILVVEDETALRNVVRRVLGAAGYEVLVAANGEEALSIVAREGSRIELVLTDLVMPGLGGRRLAEHVRSTMPHAKVILMSGYDEEIGEGLAPLGHAFLHKPFDWRTLTERVRDTLDG